MIGRGRKMNRSAGVSHRPLWPVTADWVTNGDTAAPVQVCVCVCVCLVKVWPLHSQNLTRRTSITASIHHLCWFTEGMQSQAGPSGWSSIHLCWLWDSQRKFSPTTLHPQTFSRYSPDVNASRRVGLQEIEPTIISPFLKSNYYCWAFFFILIFQGKQNRLEITVPWCIYYQSIYYH